MKENCASRALDLGLIEPATGIDITTTPTLTAIDAVFAVVPGNAAVRRRR